MSTPGGNVHSHSALRNTTRRTPNRELELCTTDAAHSSTIFSAPPMANVLITAVSVVCVAGKCGGCFAAATGRNNDAGNPAFDSRLSTIVMRYFSAHFSAHFS